MTPALICSDNVLVAKLLAEQLSGSFGSTRITIATSAAEAQAMICEDTFSVMLADASTEETIPLVRETCSETAIHCLVFGLRRDAAQVAAFAEAGAIGLVLREADLSEIGNALHSVSRGECECSPWVASALLRLVAGKSRKPAQVSADQFTSREGEILRLLDAGHSNKEIARELSIELATAKNHVHNILRKLNVPSRGKAVAELRSLGLIEAIGSEQRRL
ncbi:response regulator transcription factor [Roseibium marinum]|uniref:DNA-binding NarL/FixJ family response regulator n=1 Tax=Roseibium marinum TaxID=281252 RepID=A0A2S3UN02_9HYPH|nr:response regulator transcription factor [Roseibium marinum]POF29097.1 DNA-binding NarL/FixJ family response regulator [Roseibium marinum]